MPIRVGDPIITMRAAGPDPCRVLPPPVGPFPLTAVTVPGGSLPPGGSYFLVFTYLTPWGETLPSAEQSLVFPGGSNAIQAITPNLPPGIQNIRAYLSAAAGTEAVFQEFDVSNVPPATPATLVITSWQNSGFPPTKSSAYLPDTDGSYVSAATAFGWLNLALRKMVVQLGGIRDISGVAWPSQAAWQVLNQRWTEIETIWWSGWYQWVGRQEFTWLQNPVQSVPGYATHWANAGRDIMGLWPQPGAGPGTALLTAPVGLTDQVLNVDSVLGLQMPGMVQIDNEFVLISAPNKPGNQLVGCIRGVGGSVPATHSSGATLTQLITMFTGSRLAPDFIPSQGYMLLQLPAGWDVPLDRFMLARYREKENIRAESSQLDQEFVVAVEALRSSKDAVPKDTQVGSGRVFNSFLGGRLSGALPFGILVT